MLHFSAKDLLTTTRSVRKRMDLTTPVPHEIIEACIELALQAPTGSNRQGWQWMVVTEPDLKQGLAEIYRPAWYSYSGSGRPQYGEDDPRRDQQPRVVSSAQYLADHFHEVPVMVIPLIEGRAERNSTTVAQAGMWGSIIPAAWSFMLAAREHGLVSAYTTLHLAGELAAAELLGIPFERWTQAALIPVGYPLGGTDFQPASRLPAAELIHRERWVNR